MFGNPFEHIIIKNFMENVLPQLLKKLKGSKITIEILNIKIDDTGNEIIIKIRNDVVGNASL